MRGEGERVALEKSRERREQRRRLHIQGVSLWIILRGRAVQVQVRKLRANERGLAPKAAKRHFPTPDSRNGAAQGPTVFTFCFT